MGALAGALAEGCPTVEVDGKRVNLTPESMATVKGTPAEVG